MSSNNGIISCGKWSSFLLLPLALPFVCFSRTMFGYYFGIKEFPILLAILTAFGQILGGLGELVIRCRDNSLVKISYPISTGGNSVKYIPSHMRGPILLEILGLGVINLCLNISFYTLFSKDRAIFIEIGVKLLQILTTGLFSKVILKVVF